MVELLYWIAIAFQCSPFLFYTSYLVSWLDQLYTCRDQSLKKKLTVTPISSNPQGPISCLRHPSKMSKGQPLAGGKLTVNKPIAQIHNSLYSQLNEYNMNQSVKSHWSDVTCIQNWMEINCKPSVMEGLLVIRFTLRSENFSVGLSNWYQHWYLQGQRLYHSGLNRRTERVHRVVISRCPILSRNILTREGLLNPPHPIQATNSTVQRLVPPTSQQESLIPGFAFIQK